MKVNMPLKTDYQAYIIEGVDRLGKDTLIANIQQALGHHFVIHYDKPKKLPCYGNDLQLYQQESFDHGFRLLHAIETDQFVSWHMPTIFNRFHLGEVVYSNLYRGYSGDYVFTLEKQHRAERMERTKLILLTTSDFSFIQDDGESFDFSKKEQEQEIFKDAFARSSFPNKTIVDVSSNGTYRDPFEIFLEAVA